jgi:hypothetical protein
MVPNIYIAMQAKQSTAQHLQPRQSIWKAGLNAGSCKSSSRSPSELRKDTTAPEGQVKGPRNTNHFAAMDVAAGVHAEMHRRVLHIGQQATFHCWANAQADADDRTGRGTLQPWPMQCRDMEPRYVGPPILLYMQLRLVATASHSCIAAQLCTACGAGTFVQCQHVSRTIFKYARGTRSSQATSVS